MTWGTRNGFHVSFSKRLKAGNPKSQRGSREAKIENDAPGVRPRTGGSSRHGIYRWISVSSQKIIVFEIHVKSTNDGKQVSLKITWIYNDFYNDFTGIGSPQVFFFPEKSAPQNHRRFWTESQWPGKWRNCTATRLLRRRRQSPRRCLFLNGWGAQKRHTVARLKTSSGWMDDNGWAQQSGYFGTIRIFLIRMSNHEMDEYSMVRM